MADDSFDPLVWFSDRVADAVDWIHDTFSDPALSRELRADLGVKDDVELTGDLPTGDKIRMRHPDGSAVDPDKAAFDATVAEIKAAYGVLVDFFGHLDLTLEELWDFLFLLGQLGLSESIRARWPWITNILRTTGYLTAVGRAAATPALTQSSEEVEAVDVLRAIDALRGDSGVRSDTTFPDKREMARNTAGTTLAVLSAIFGPDIGLRAAYGYEADFGSLTPQSDEIAQGAFTVDVFDKDPAGTAGFDGHAGLTFVWVPSKAAVPGPPDGSPATPTRVHVAVGGGVSWTKGRFNATVEAPAAANLFYDGATGWDAEPGVVVTAALGFGRADAKALSWGERDGAHLTADVIALRGELSKTPSIRLEAKVVDLSLALTDGDAFLQSLSKELKTSFDVAVVYDKDGLRLDGGPFAKKATDGGSAPRSLAAPVPSPPATARSLGAPATVARALPVHTTSGGLEAELPASLTRFGPFRIQKNRIGIGRRPDGKDGTSLELSTSVDLDIGPVNLTVDRIGVSVDVGGGGVEPNLGIVDYDFGFKPPNGIGVKIDAKVIRGGGFLTLDADRGEYAGVLELSFKGLTIKAVGLINTKAPEPAGWSLLLLLFAEFRATPWVVGPGFTITAIGGIIGLQHQASVDELRTGLGTNLYDDILFPADPVKDAPRIISRLRTIFPVSPGGLVVGPTVEANWGRRGLVTARMAILAQFAGVFGGGDVRFTRLTLLGTVRAAAPPLEVDAPRLVQLTADVLGDYDVESGLVAIDARLRDSKLGGVEFTGSLLIRIGLGDNPAFAISAGGFHPAFVDLPPAMPARIDRLGLRWQLGSHVTVTLQAYVAITASSWQLGAALSIVADLGPVDIDGGLHFDAIAYDDGRFSVDLGGHVRVRWRGHTLMSVELEMTMERAANQLWHATGSASFSILWWDKTVDFETTWGTERSLPPAAGVDAAALVRAALEDAASWSASMPVGGESLVTLAGAPAAGVLAHPLGTLTVAQRVAPIGLRLDHVDGAPVASRHGREPRDDPRRAGRGHLQPGDRAVRPEPVPGAERRRPPDQADVRAPARRRPHRAARPDQPCRHGAGLRLRAGDPGPLRRTRATARRARSRSRTATWGGTSRAASPPCHPCASTSASGPSRPSCASG